MENTLSLTKYWLENIVLGLDFCPFAKIPYENGQIRMSVCAESREQEQTAFFLEELEFLHRSHPLDVLTTIVVYPNGSPNFYEFNDFVGFLESMLDEAKLSDIFQLVVFHPKFVFVDTDFLDLGNYVNRSPFPVLHILRSEEITRALKNPRDAEIISFNNDRKLHEIPRETLDKLFYFL